MTDAIHEQIRRVLLNDWDPSNASRFEAASGEYDSYIGPLHQMIQRGANEGEIVDYLHEREQEIMCFPGLGKERLRRVAQNLLTLKTADS